MFSSQGFVTVIKLKYLVSNNMLQQKRETRLNSEVEQSMLGLDSPVTQISRNPKSRGTARGRNRPIPIKINDLATEHGGRKRGKSGR